VADQHDRLVRCFSSVFPTLTEEEIQAANVPLLIDLDSLAAVTLVAVLNDEFEVDMDLEHLLKLGTFQALREYLREQAVSTGPLDEQGAR
jgi:acyl carrier protein